MLLYLDPWSGISGDMLLASLLDLEREDARLERLLREAIASLGLDADILRVSRTTEWGISCTKVSVGAENHLELRHLDQLQEMVDKSGLAEAVKAKSISALHRLAEIEAKVHGCAEEDVHFHEIGAVDTLVDVVGAFVLTEAIGIDRVVVGVIPVGGGTVNIAHGVVGVPAPATTALLRGYPIVGGPEDRELTTPTGALLVGQLAAEAGSLPRMVPSGIGYGGGSMRLDRGPNLLRVVVGAPVSAPSTADEGPCLSAERDTVIELQTNLDDVTPEVIAYAVRAARQAGALDVWTVNAVMKKERAGVILHALVVPDRESAVAQAIFVETGTLGVRRHIVDRWLVERGTITVDTSGGAVRVKWGRNDGRLVSLAPEFDDAAAVAAAAGRPLKDVMEAAIAAARRLLGQGHLLP